MINVPQTGKVLLKFGAPWCQPCKAIAPHVAKAMEQHPDAQTIEVDGDESPDFAVNYGVQGYPTLIGIVDGQEVSRMTGSMGLGPSTIREFIRNAFEV